MFEQGRATHIYIPRLFFVGTEHFTSVENFGWFFITLCSVLCTSARLYTHFISSSMCMSALTGDKFMWMGKSRHVKFLWTLFFY